MDPSKLKLWLLARDRRIRRGVLCADLGKKVILVEREKRLGGVC